jgi:endonuclease-3
VAARKVTLREQRARAARIYAALDRLYPEVKCTLEYRSPFQLLVMTILAAQCTDARVNIVCKDLFRKYRTPADFASAPLVDLERAVQPCGFYRNKARNIQAACRRLMEAYGGEVPQRMEDLLSLPGVGRKTANVLLGECFGKQGVIVDTHCTRLVNRLGFAQGSDPVKLEQALMKVWPPEHWTRFSHFMVFHGRAVCTARAPRCASCVLRPDCPWPDSHAAKKRAAKKKGG